MKMFVIHIRNLRRDLKMIRNLKVGHILMWFVCKMVIVK